MKQINFDFDKVQDQIMMLYNDVLDYFSSLNLYQIIAWSAIGLGLVLIIVSFILW